MSLAELEQYLAKAADLLRGSIDQADFKAYIFPLMFFKRISDVYLEEFAEALDESGGDHEGTPRTSAPLRRLGSTQATRDCADPARLISVKVAPED